MAWWDDLIDFGKTYGKDIVSVGSDVWDIYNAAQQRGVADSAMRPGPGGMVDPWQPMRGQAQQNFTQLQNNPNSVVNLPGYRFQQQQGEQAINRAAAKSGHFQSPNRIQALMDFNQGLAGQNYGDEWQRQFQAGGGDINPNAQMFQSTMQNQSIASRNAAAGGQDIFKTISKYFDFDSPQQQPGGVGRQLQDAGQNAIVDYATDTLSGVVEQYAGNAGINASTGGLSGDFDALNTGTGFDAGADSFYGDLPGPSLAASVGSNAFGSQGLVGEMANLSGDATGALADVTGNMGSTGVGLASAGAGLIGNYIGNKIGGPNTGVMTGMASTIATNSLLSSGASAGAGAGLGMAAMAGPAAMAVAAAMMVSNSAKDDKMRKKALYDLYKTVDWNNLQDSPYGKDGEVLKGYQWKDPTTGKTEWIPESYRGTVMSGNSDTPSIRTIGGGLIDPFEGLLDPNKLFTGPEQSFGGGVTSQASINTSDIGSQINFAKNWASDKPDTFNGEVIDYGYADRKYSSLYDTNQAQLSFGGEAKQTGVSVGQSTNPSQAGFLTGLWEGKGTGGTGYVGQKDALQSLARWSDTGQGSSDKVGSINNFNWSTGSYQSLAQQESAR